MSTIEVPYETYRMLQEHFRILNQVQKTHEGLADYEELIEPWTPSDWNQEEQISCPELTVGFLKDAEKLRKRMKIDLPQNND
ncbi:hypothetical protein HYO99_gp08 [Roseobacter phage RD-1410W1-01]|uniref:Uncharacterized protein n=1 Tax=Roseobacter phage RD-1410W1-01 TaxID=1815984 RepID=A0A191VYE6_9CAUD|nr:hypothetical protein HYO99_gp08 [Roseobacter phage RD-1410W1-01]ANJ20742.1 hypothetical protein RDp01_gp08 [Roseobacter phage RD-1410W1-01]